VVLVRFDKHLTKGAEVSLRGSLYQLLAGDLVLRELDAFRHVEVKFEKDLIAIGLALVIAADLGSDVHPVLDAVNRVQVGGEEQVWEEVLELVVARVLDNRHSKQQIPSSKELQSSGTLGVREPSCRDNRQGKKPEDSVTRGSTVNSPVRVRSRRLRHWRRRARRKGSLKLLVAFRLSETSAGKEASEAAKRSALSNVASRSSPSCVLVSSRYSSRFLSQSNSG